MFCCHADGSRLRCASFKAPEDFAKLTSGPNFPGLLARAQWVGAAQPGRFAGERTRALAACSTIWFSRAPRKTRGRYFQRKLRRQGRKHKPAKEKAGVAVSSEKIYAAEFRDSKDADVSVVWLMRHMVLPLVAMRPCRFSGAPGRRRRRRRRAAGWSWRIRGDTPCW